MKAKVYLLVTVSLGLSLFLFTPSAAWSEHLEHHDWHSGWHHDQHRGFHWSPDSGWHSGRHHGWHSGLHHDWHNSRQHFSPWNSFSRPFAGSSVIIRNPFFCVPCLLGFSSRSLLFSHLHHTHGITVELIPRLLVPTGSGFVFFGF